MCDRTMITQQFQDDFCLLFGGGGIFWCDKLLEGGTKGRVLEASTGN